MPAHHIVPRFVIARWQRADGRVTVADLEHLVVRDEAPERLDARRDFNRLELHQDPEALEGYFSALESDASRAFEQLVRALPPAQHAVHARNNGFKPRQLLKNKKAVRLAQFLAAQAVRSPDWRREANAHTAAAVKEEVERKVRAELETATDPARIAELEQRLGLRYQALAQGDMLPQLGAALTERIGLVLYTEYVTTVVRLPAPLLCLGNDPLLFFSSDRDVGVGSYSQIATRRGGNPFSVRQGVDALLSAAADVARGHRMIAMPLDPSHAVVLHPAALPVMPGLVDAAPDFGQLLNAGAMEASRRWLVVPPGRTEEAREAIYRQHPGLRKADAHRREHGKPLHTDPASGAARP